MHGLFQFPIVLEDSPKLQNKVSAALTAFINACHLVTVSKCYLPFHKDLLSNFKVPGTTLDARDTNMSKRQIPVLATHTF